MCMCELHCNLADMLQDFVFLVKIAEMCLQQLYIPPGMEEQARPHS